MINLFVTVTEPPKISFHPRSVGFVVMHLHKHETGIFHRSKGFRFSEVRLRSSNGNILEDVGS